MRGRSHREAFPGDDDPIRKGAVVDYYERIAGRMLPHVAGRPLVLQRFPDGIDGFGFYQKNTPDHVPDWIGRVEVDTADGGSTRYPVVDDAAGIVYLANQGAIVFHTLLAEADAPTSPVEVIFDLDPSSDDLAPVRAAAAELRSVLEDLGLAPRVKSTGSRGLHVVVDVIDDGEVGFDLTSSFARRVAEIALAADFGPRRITIANIFRRLAQKTDPWADPPRPTSTIADALTRLEESD